MVRGITSSAKSPARTRRAVRLYKRLEPPCPPTRTRLQPSPRARQPPRKHDGGMISVLYKKKDRTDPRPQTDHPAQCRLQIPCVECSRRGSTKQRSSSSHNSKTASSRRLHSRKHHAIANASAIAEERTSKRSLSFWHGEGVHGVMGLPHEAIKALGYPDEEGGEARVRAMGVPSAFCCSLAIPRERATRTASLWICRGRAPDVRDTWLSHSAGHCGGEWRMPLFAPFVGFTWCYLSVGQPGSGSWRLSRDIS